MTFDPDINFTEHMSQFDTFLIGRKNVVSSHPPSR